MTSARDWVDVEVATLSQLLPAVELLGDGWLNDLERDRLAAISSHRRRRQFLAGHWLARVMAARRFGSRAEDWQLGRSPAGAPTLSPASDMPGEGIHVSIAHSDQTVCAAVSCRPVGIDLESNGRERDWLALARMALPPAELSRLRQLPPDSRRARFALFWTLAEAAGKQDGRGLILSESRRRHWTECRPDRSEAVTWQFQDGCLALVGAVRRELACYGLPAPSAERRFWRESAPLQ